jgi:hypothetical protein
VTFFTTPVNWVAKILEVRTIKYFNIVGFENCKRVVIW